MIKNILLSILLLFKIFPAVVSAYDDPTLEITNIGNVKPIDAESILFPFPGVIPINIKVNQICDERFDVGGESPRKAKFVVKTSGDPDKIGLALFAHGDDKINYLEDTTVVKKVTESVDKSAKTKTYVVEFADKSDSMTYHINIKDENTVSFISAGRYLKVWDCKVPIFGGIYQQPGCSDLYKSSYSLKYADKIMDVGTTYSSNLANHLIWGKTYTADFGDGRLNELIKPDKFKIIANPTDDVYLKPVEAFKKDYCMDPWGFTPMGEPKMILECSDSDEMLHLKITFSTLVKITQVVIRLDGADPAWQTLSGDAVGLTFIKSWPITDMCDKEVSIELTNEYGNTKSFNLGKIVCRSCKLMWFQAKDGGILSNKAINNWVKPDENMSVGETGLVAAKSIEVGRGGRGKYNYAGGESVVSMKDWSKMLDKNLGFDVHKESFTIENNIGVVAKVNVIVAPEIIVKENVTEINAILIAYGGDIVFETKGDKTDLQLTINGSLVSKGDIIVKRNMDNNDQASVKVNFMPDYLFRLPAGLVEVMGNWGMGD